MEKTRRRDGDRLDQARLIIGAVAVLLLGVLVWSVFDSRDDADQAEQETRTLAQQVTVACEGGGPAARELESIGACEKAATAAVGAPATESAPVYQVATDDQVRAAVSEYLRTHPPADGRTPSTAEVETAVTRVCQAIGCQGQPGLPGEDGRDASDVQVANQVGAWCSRNNGCLPTPDEIQAAVSAYCGAEPSPCVGPKGDQGDQGEPGEQGEPALVLPVYYETRSEPGPLGETLVTYRCNLRNPSDPPHYDCIEE